MTGSLALDTAISLGAIALMALVAWVAFRASPPPVDEARARDRLALEEPDFAPAAILVGEDGAAAVAADASGEGAVVVRIGADLATRRFTRETARIETGPDALIIRLREFGHRTIEIRSDGAAGWPANWPEDWAARLR